MTDREAKFLEWLREPDMPKEIILQAAGGVSTLYMAGLVYEIIEKKFLEIVGEK